MNKPTSLRFEAIFFDMDGLLVNTEGIYLSATNEILSPLGLEISLNWYIQENLGKGLSNIEIASELARKKGVSEDIIAQLRPRRNRRYGEMLKTHVSVVDGVQDVLTALHGRFIMGIVTSSRKDHFDIIMEKTRLRAFFDFALTADDATELKPHPELYLKAVEKSEKTKERCLALEDSARGVTAAKAAGLICYAVPDTLTRVQDFSIADKVLDSIRDVPVLLGV